MTNLRTDEIVFIRNLTKIGTDENKAIYSMNVQSCIMSTFISINIMPLFRQTNPKITKIVILIK